MRQGKLIHSLGMGLQRAVFGCQHRPCGKDCAFPPCQTFGLALFAPAVGNGQERIHMFNDEELAEIIAGTYSTTMHRSYCLQPIYPVFRCDNDSAQIIGLHIGRTLVKGRGNAGFL